MNKFVVGMRLGSEEKVIFFDGSVSSPFPKFNKKQKLTAMFVRKSRVWLLDNAYNIAKTDKSSLIRFTLIGELTAKHPNQSVLDEAELYLAEGGGGGVEKVK